ncbi:MAG: hypothetical protein KU37_05040 [Sulfuricurvum sp. PC08-66]|nr:MAG: hypothetical protein KU37_05040 [Sulfuricurvum sp. PC08-66]
MKKFLEWFAPKTWALLLFVLVVVLLLVSQHERFEEFMHRTVAHTPLLHPSHVEVRLGLYSEIIDAQK